MFYMICEYFYGGIIYIVMCIIRCMWDINDYMNNILLWILKIWKQIFFYFNINKYDYVY